MDIKPIRSDADHRAAVDEIRALWNAAPDSPEEDRLDILATLVDEYERKRWPIDKLDPVEAIEAAMQSEGHTRADLAALALTLLAASRLPLLPTVLIGVASAGLLRQFLPGTVL